MDELRQEISAYYGGIAADADNPAFARMRREVAEAMERFAKGNPAAHPALMKARLHEEISERFEPVVLAHSPFFFEMGVRPSGNDGRPSPLSAAAWMYYYRQALCTASPAWKNLLACSEAPLSLAAVRGPFEALHDAGYAKLLRLGLAAVIDQIQVYKDISTDADRPFLEAAARSAYAVLGVAKRFGRKAELLLAASPRGGQEQNLRRVAETAARVPAAAPKTFFEGLCALAFYREVTASLECVPLALPRRVDQLLINLYRADLAEGRLNEPDAAALLARWLLHLDARAAGTPAGALVLSCAGEENELTKLIADVHARSGLQNLQIGQGAGDPPAPACVRCEIGVPRVLELCLQPQAAKDAPADVAAALPRAYVPSLTWEEFYHHFTDVLTSLVRASRKWTKQAAGLWPQVQPCPLLSASLEGCIESAKDCIAGGVREVVLTGTQEASVSLAAIKHAVYDGAAGTRRPAGRAQVAASLAQIAPPGVAQSLDPLAAAIARDLAAVGR